MANQKRAKKTPMAEFKARIAAQAKMAAKAKKDGDYELARTWARDVADLECIYAALQANDYECAMHIADEVDTAVRDEIPNALYEKMTKVMGHK